MDQGACSARVAGENGGALTAPAVNVLRLQAIEGQMEDLRKHEGGDAPLVSVLEKELKLVSAGCTCTACTPLGRLWLCCPAALHRPHPLCTMHVSCTWLW